MLNVVAQAAASPPALGVEVMERSTVCSKQHRQMSDAFKMMSRGGGKGLAQMARMMGGGNDMARLQSLGGGKLAQQDPNSPPVGLPGLGGAPGGLPGLGGLPGFNPNKK